MQPSEYLDRLVFANRDAALAYLNSDPEAHTFTGSEVNLKHELVVRVRDSVSYRIGAMGYHLACLDAADAAAQKYARSHVGRQNLIQDMRPFIMQQRYILDDILCGSMSLLDYMARLIACTMHASVNVRRCDWDRLYKWSKHGGDTGAGPSKLKGSVVGQIIVSENEAWIQALYDYRSKVIHYEAIPPGATLTYTERIGEPAEFGKFGVEVPEKFVRRLKLSEVREGVTISEAVSHLIVKLARAATDILQAVSAEMEERRAERFAERGR